MRTSPFSILFVLAISSVVALPVTATADEIVIQDTAGIPREASDVEGLGRVDFTVADAAGQPAENAVVTLTNTVTGETLTVNSAAGIASFDGVAAGTWTVASATPGITFTNISIFAVSTGVLAGGATAGTAIIIVGGAGAATAAGIGIHDATSGDDNDDPVLSPSS